MLGMRASSLCQQARLARGGGAGAALPLRAATPRPSLQQQQRQQHRRRHRALVAVGAGPAGVDAGATSSSSSSASGARQLASAASSALHKAEDALVAAEHTVAEVVSHAFPGHHHAGQKEGEEEEEDMTEATVTDDAPPEPTAAASAAAARRALEKQRAVDEAAAAAPSLAQRAIDARDWAVETGFASAVGAAAGAGLAATLAVAVYRSWRRASSPRAVRRRVLDRNRALVDALRDYLPDKRAQLTPAIAAKIRARSGFTAVEVFRKFLWYVLRDRRFDGEAVADAAALKISLGLTDEQAAEALRERADRVYEKYGTLMLGAEAQGLSAAGLERKAACRALFAKLLYLAETDALVGPAAATGKAGDGGRAVFSAADLRDVFGATEDDVDAVRIASLDEEGAVERLEAMMGRARHAEAVMEAAGMAEEEAVDRKWEEDQEAAKTKKKEEDEAAAKKKEEGGGGDGAAPTAAAS